MGGIRCFIFDLDGTLVDTREANFRAYQATFVELGMPLSSGQYDGYFGLVMQDMLRLHAARYGIEVDENLIQECKDLKSREYVKHLQLAVPIEPTVTVLQQVTGKFHVGLATTASQANALAVLRHTDLERYFDFAIFAEGVEHTKPDPECFVRVAEHFGVLPAECAIFEDSDSGIAAAAAFGGKVVKVLQ